MTVLSGDARCHRTDRIVVNMKCTKLVFSYLKLPLKTEFTDSDFYNSSWEIKANEEPYCCRKLTLWSRILEKLIVKQLIKKSN